MLTKNNFLAQMMCLFGLHEYILFEQNVNYGKFADLPDDAPEWQRKKRQSEMNLNSDHDTQMYIRYSFKKDFRMNSMEVEPFKAPKILGDVFEAIIGAIFKDSGDTGYGIDSVNQVLKSLMAPFVLYVAKFSKSI